MAISSHFPEVERKFFIKNPGCLMQFYNKIANAIIFPEREKF